MFTLRRLTQEVTQQYHLFQFQGTISVFKTKQFIHHMRQFEEAFDVKVESQDTLHQGSLVSHRRNGEECILCSFQKPI